MTGPTTTTGPRDPAGGDAAGRLRELLVLVRTVGYTRRDEPFALSSGGTSHDYVDLRRAVARGRDLRLAATAVLDAVAATGVEFDAIGGMTMGADPVSHAAALLGDRAWFSVRKAEKSHGSRRRIEGAELGPGARVVVFEDTVTTGRSLLEALDVVVESGAQVALACTLLDRGDTGAALVAARGVEYRALFTYRDLGIAPIASAAGTGPASAAPGERAPA